MSAEFEQVFLDALEDLREGRAEPIERYLELVPKSERAQLADLLAMYFASRRTSASREVNSRSYERVLAAFDRLTESKGEAGILPGLLTELRRTRRLRRQDVTRQLCEHFQLSDNGLVQFEREYHRLETGQLHGPLLSKRLLQALADLFRIDLDDLLSASLPVPEPHARYEAQAFARSEGIIRASHAPPPGEEKPPDPVVQELFYGGRDA
jgi:hypothetical protein